MGVFSDLYSVTEQIRKIPGIEKKPAGGLASFGSTIGKALRLCLEEREILFFCLLQWAAIGLAYLLWAQVMDWVPESTWQEISRKRGSNSSVNLLFTLWSFLCVGLAAYPVGMFSGCMGAAHFLRASGKESTIAACLRLVVPRSWSLWAFHWIDGWITVVQIMERLPSKERRTAAEKALSEATYYAWKLGVAGVLPGILTGNKLVMAGWNSALFVRENFLAVARLRAGYSLLCWVVGISAYVGTVLLFRFVEIIPDGQQVYGHMYTLYIWAGLPIMVATGVVMLVLRPLYVLAICDLYSQYLRKNDLPDNLPENPPRVVNALVAFLCLCVLLLAVFLYQRELGIAQLLTLRPGGGA